MRIVLAILALVLMPTVAFFVWAWMIKIVREQQLAGTLPRWQELPWTWLMITGLALAIAAVLYLVLFTERPEGGFFGPQRGGIIGPPALQDHARIAPEDPASGPPARRMAV
jgi:hypothetical protein